MLMKISFQILFIHLHKILEPKNFYFTFAVLGLYRNLHSATSYCLSKNDVVTMCPLKL